MTDPTGTHRRDFLKASAAATAGLGFLPNVHAKGNDTIKVGLIGCGGRGTGAADNSARRRAPLQHQDPRAGRRVRGPPARTAATPSENSEHGKDKFDVADERCFVGFDAYQKVIDCCDLVMLATPPGFRPQHIEAVVKAGKNLFTEKPVGVDPTGIRKVPGRLRRGQEQEAGGRRRHPAPARGRLHREHQAHPRRRDRRHHLGPRLLESGGPSGRTSASRAGATPSTSFATGTTSSGSAAITSSSSTCTISTWRAGSWAHPGPRRGHGRPAGDQRARARPELRSLRRRLRVPERRPRPLSMCRQIEGCENNVSELVHRHQAGSSTAAASGSPASPMRASGPGASTPTSRSTSTCWRASSPASRSTSSSRWPRAPWWRSWAGCRRTPARPSPGSRPSIRSSTRSPNEYGLESAKPDLQSVFKKPGGYTADL